MALSRCIAALAGGALALVALAPGPGTAHARPKTYRVKIDSKPDGAMVYLKDGDKEQLGRTPYEGRLPAGRHTVIIELDGYVAQVQDIRVKRKSGVQRFRVELDKLEEGSIEVLPARAQAQVRGARIFIDGVDEGNLPDTISVEAGPHQVEVKKEGYKTFEVWVEVAAGETKKVSVELIPEEGSRLAAAVEGGSEEGGGDEETGEEEEDGGEEDVEIEDGAEPERERDVPFISLAGGLELGGRQFRFKNPTMGNLRPYDAGGVPVIRLSADLVPLASVDSVLANGWTLRASYARATPLESSARVNEGQQSERTVSVPTTWSELDVALAFRLRFGRGSHIGVQGGYGIHTFTFTYDAESDQLSQEIPDVTYKFISIGADARLAFGGRFALLLAGGPRLVRDTGALAKLFQSTDVVAFGLSGGLSAALSRSFEARLVGRYDQYGHTFTPQNAAGAAMADGGTDRMFGVTLSAAFIY